MGMRTARDVVREAIYKVVPGSQTLQSAFYAQPDAMQKRGMLFDVLTDAEGNLLYIVGQGTIGDSTIG